MKLLALATGLLVLSTFMAQTASKRQRDIDALTSTSDHRAAAYHYNQLAQSHFREYQKNKKRARYHIGLALKAEKAKTHAEAQESKAVEAKKA
jgi:hypothetical protein